MKKILFYTDTVQLGGAELQMLLLAKFLNKEQFTPILACSNFEQLNSWCNKWEKEGLQVIRLNVKSKHDPKHYTQLKRIIKEDTIDILHAHVWNPASCRYAYFAASSSKIPIITTEHDPFALGFIKNIFKKIALNKVSNIVTVSENNAEVLRHLYPKHKNKISVIHNGIDTNWWQSQLRPVTEKDIIKTKTETFHAKKDTFIITSIAELHERKGLKYLIEAIPKVVEKFPNTKLVIIGNGPDHNNLETLIKKLDMEAHIILLGQQKEIPRLLKSSNMFVLPSRREAFGLVLLEASMIPLPIIATKVGGIPEIIKENKTGIVVEAENTEKLIKAIKLLIENPDISNKIAQNSHLNTQQNFSAKKMAKKYIEIYTSL